MAEPSVNPNALGAPAEGFGQTVSFAFDPRGTEPPMVKPITSRGPNISVSGGGSGVASRVDPNSVKVEQGQDPTAALLMKVGGDMLNAKIDEARSKQYVDGMQQAMSGKGIQEVKESVPWYAKLFGDTPVIEGARAYSAQDTVNKVITDQTNNLHEIQKLGPKEASEHFNKAIKNALTGDSQTDAVIMKGMTEQLPTLMKAQAKANYGYNQAVAQRNLGQSMQSGASSLQAYGEAFAKDGMSAEDFRAASDKFVASVLPPAGINEESYQKTLTATMIGMAQRGEFHALEALRSSGAVGALTNEQAVRVEAAATAGAKRSRDNYAFKYVGVMAEIKSDSVRPPDGTTVNNLKDRIERANTAYTKLTGNKEGLWSSDQITDMLTGSMNAFKQADKETVNNARIINDHNATEAAKTAAAATNKAIITSMVSNGDAAKAKMMDGIKSDDVDLAMYTMSKADPVAGNKMMHLNWANGTVSKLISNELQAPLKMAAGEYASGNNTAPPEEFFKSVNLYRAMVQQGGPDFANSYFGDYAKTIAFASRQLGTEVLGNTRGADIYSQAMEVSKRRVDPMDKKEREAIVKKVISSGSSIFPRSWGGGANLRPDAARRLAEEVEESAQGWKAQGQSDEEATARALGEVLGPKNESGSHTGGPGAEILGGYMIKRTVGSTADTLSTLMHGKGQGVTKTEVADDTKDEIFVDFMRDHVKVPDTAGTVNITRTTDAGGTARFQVSYQDKDDKHGLRSFSAAELASFAAESSKWKRMPRWTGVRGETTEETAAYNADKANREATAVEPIKTVYGAPINYTPDNYARGAAIARQQVIDSQKLKRK